MEPTPETPGVVERATLTARQVEALTFLGGPATHCMLEGGSGSGKTFIGVAALILRALAAPGSRHALFRHRFNHAKISVWNDTLPTVLAKRFPSIPVTMNASDFYAEFGNGSQIWIGGLDEKARVEKILGMTLATVYLNETSQIGFDAVQIAWTRLRQLSMREVEGVEKRPLRLKCLYDQNPPSARHWSYSLFHEHLDPEAHTPLVDPDDFAAFSMHPRDNADNLGEGYLKMLASLGARKRRRFWDGQYGQDVEGALWSSDGIAATRVLERPMDMQRIVVGVDPAVSAKETSDETGIITAGLRAGHVYIWRDDTLRGSPYGWGRAVASAFIDEGADHVTAEKNQGGDLVKSNIKQIDITIPVRLVTATRGKYVRAEPVANIWEQGRGHIVGSMPDLEDELTSWDPADEDAPSPNRLDAMVWAVTDLLNLRPAGAWGTPMLHRDAARESGKLRGGRLVLRSLAGARR